MDHARVVDLLRKADHLPLIKEYLLAVQKTNLGAVNEAVRPELADDWERGLCLAALYLFRRISFRVTASSPSHGASRIARRLGGLYWS